MGTHTVLTVPDRVVPAAVNRKRKMTRRFFCFFTGKSVGWGSFFFKRTEPEKKRKDGNLGRFWSGKTDKKKRLSVLGSHKPAYGVLFRARILHGSLLLYIPVAWYRVIPGRRRDTPLRRQSQSSQLVRIWRVTRTTACTSSSPLFPVKVLSAEVVVIVVRSMC